MRKHSRAGCAAGAPGLCRHAFQSCCAAGKAARAAHPESGQRQAQSGEQSRRAGCAPGGSLLLWGTWLPAHCTACALPTSWIGAVTREQGRRGAGGGAGARCLSRTGLDHGPFQGVRPMRPHGAAGKTNQHIKNEPSSRLQVWQQQHLPTYHCIYNFCTLLQQQLRSLPDAHLRAIYASIVS